MKEQFENAVQFVKDNPLKVAGITAGVIITGVVVFKALQYGQEIPEELSNVANSLEEIVEEVL